MSTTTGSDRREPTEQVRDAGMELNRIAIASRKTVKEPADGYKKYF